MFDKIRISPLKSVMTDDNFMTDDIRNFMTQQKQRKELILIDNKNTFNQRFQPIQRSQPIFMTDGIRNLIHTKHNQGNAKLRIFSFTPQRLRIGNVV